MSLNISHSVVQTCDDLLTLSPDVLIYARVTFVSSFFYMTEVESVTQGIEMYAKRKSASHYIWRRCPKSAICLRLLLAQKQINWAF